MPQAKQLSNRKRRSRAAPVLGAAGLLALASSASAEAMSTANTEMSHQLLLGEEEISDVSLSTFHVFDKENVGSLKSGVQLARGGGGCGGGCGGGGCRGCGGGCGGCGGGCARGCGGGCRIGFGFGGCGGCGCAGCGLGWWGAAYPGAVAMAHHERAIRLLADHLGFSIVHSALLTASDKADIVA